MHAIGSAPGAARLYAAVGVLLLLASQNGDARAGAANVPMAASQNVPQSLRMGGAKSVTRFFVTSRGIGKGGDLGGLAGLHRHRFGKRLVTGGRADNFVIADRELEQLHPAGGDLPILAGHRAAGGDRAVDCEAAGEPLHAPDAQAPRASGTLESHYAPRATLRLMSAEALHTALHTPGGLPEGLAVYSRTPALQVVHRHMPALPDRAAHELFSVLRELDAEGVQLIWVEEPPPGPEWDGVRDRLQRASAP